MAVITITGDPNSGKTTVARKLAALLDYHYHYVGGVMREMAAERGLSIEAFYEQLQNDPELEKSIDARQAELMKTQDNLIVEGRMAFFFPSPFKKINILLKVDWNDSALRAKGRPENAHKSLDMIVWETKKRVHNERERYKALYGIENHLDEKYFNIIIDTTNLKPDAVWEELLEHLKAFL